MRWVATTIFGLGSAMFFAKQRDRKKLFDDYCTTEDPSTILIERIRYHYGEAFAKEARLPRPQIREALFLKSTLKHWFEDPMKVLLRTSVAAV